MLEVILFLAGTFLGGIVGFGMCALLSINKGN